MSEAIATEYGPEVVVHGHYYVDSLTGEVLSLVADDPQEPFRVTDQSSADWVLERMAEVEGEMLALERRKQALIDNIDSMMYPLKHRAAWLSLRFTEELRAFASTELEGKKVRTWKSAFGSLSFRRKPPRLVVTDEALALEWAKVNQPAAVKVKETLLISEMETPKAGSVAPAGFAIEPESSSFKVSTGI